MGRPSKQRGIRAAAMAMTVLAVVAGSGACSETTVDPEQERNVRPGLRPEGSPRDEEQ